MDLPEGLTFNKIADAKIDEKLRPIRYMQGYSFPFLLSLFWSNNSSSSLTSLATREEWHRLYIDLLSFELGDELEINIPPSEEKGSLYSFEKFKDKDFKRAVVSIKNPKYISSLLDRYAYAFKNGNMISEGNAYSYKKHIQMLPELFQKQFEDFDGKISININDYEDEFLHLPELLYSLHTDGFIKIEYVGYSFWAYPNDLTYTFDVRFLKSPQEIVDIENYWIYYGDLRANEADGVALYKSNKYPFKSTKGNAFALLCYLIKNHGVHIPMTEIAKDIDLGIKDKKVIKSRIKDYVKEIKANLCITKDAESSIEIMIVKDSVILISNPPKPKKAKSL